MLKQNIIRTFLFVAFFSIGAAVLGVSILVDDLLRYHHNRQLLETAKRNLQRLELLNSDYDALLQQLQADANFVKRIAPATVGSEPAEVDTIYPKATAEQLAAAQKVLSEDLARQRTQPTVPNWLRRCSQPWRRTVLFLAGTFLILISFVSFSPAKEKG